MKPRATSMLAAVLLTAAAACSASKSSNVPTSPGVTLSATVKVSDVLSGAAVAGATVSGGGLTGGTTNAAGLISVTSSSVSSFGIDVSSAGYVTRNTLLKVPGADASVNLIKDDFNLTAFNEMFRVAALQRWTSQPALLIMTNVLDYDEGTKKFTARDEALTPDEVQSITADLTFGLPQLTGGTFQNFASVQTMSPTPGSDVTMAVDGRITYGRCTGLSSAGTGTWIFRDDSVVTGGMLCVSRDFELSGSSLLRGVRIHELGHALGAQHVDPSVELSIMNPFITLNDLTDPDRARAKVAFARAPGNRTPDRDPSGFSTNSLARRVMTVDGCRVNR